VVGDVTSARMREAFFTSVEGARARPDESLSVLRGRVERRLGEEEELVVDPALFRRLSEWIPGIAAVDVRLKPGRYRNELSRFRYDVIIRVGPESLTPLDAVHHAWEPSFMEASAIEALLPQDPDRALVIAGVPNARVLEAVVGAEALLSGEGQSVGDWRSIAAKRWATRSDLARDPQDFVDLGVAMKRPVNVTWSEQVDRFDVVFRPPGRTIHPLRSSSPPDSRPIGHLASQPLSVALMPHVEAELRRDLPRTLPEPMIPDRFELVARLPRTPSGKLDRRALPAPGRRRPPLPHDYVPPKGATEKMLVSLWSQVLGVDRVGVTDSFFDVGGNSILSVRLSMELHKQMAQELPLVALFQYPTVRSLAAFLDRSSLEGGLPEDGLDERAEKRRQAFARSRRPRRT
jgi:acyl carrier protein